jgi:hypothetical protein
MTEKLTNREKLDREIKTLDDDQVLEVLEYISIMKSLRNQESQAEKLNDQVTGWLSSHGDFHGPSLSRRQAGEGLIIPRSRRAVTH